MVTLWLFTKTNSEDGAKLLAGRISSILSSPIQIQSIESYPKIAGHKIRASFENVGTSWPEVVLETIERAQEIGRGWSHNGDIREEIDLISRESKVSGVEMIQIQRARE